MNAYARRSKLQLFQLPSFPFVFAELAERSGNDRIQDMQWLEKNEYGDSLFFIEKNRC
jgi:hypothetical protein